MSRLRLVLFAHGSRDSRWREPFERLRADIVSQHGGESVRLAYMEFSQPTLMEVAVESVRDGVGVLRVLPLFLAAGAHVSSDIPNQAAAVRERFPHLDVEILPPIGEDPGLNELLRTIAGKALREVAHRG